jgi:hypothetical protein
MAYDAEDDHDCPHCPPAEMQGHHDMHADMHSGMVAEMPCADGLSDCSLDGDFSHDARFGQAKLKDAQSDLPAVVVSALPVSQVSASARERSPPLFTKAHPGAPPPLHVLYCVYLD